MSFNECHNIRKMQHNTHNHNRNHNFDLCTGTPHRAQFCIWLCVSIEIWQGKTVHVLTNAKTKYIFVIWSKILASCKQWINTNSKMAFCLMTYFMPFDRRTSCQAIKSTLNHLPYIHFHIEIIPVGFLFSSIDIEMFFIHAPLFFSFKWTMKRETSKQYRSFQCEILSQFVFDCSFDLQAFRMERVKNKTKMRTFEIECHFHWIDSMQIQLNFKSIQ